jgi:hypothetical protein
MQTASRSLQFPTVITTRKNHAARAHEATFNQALDGSVDRRWYSLAKWMKSDEQVFRISGKPGSEKSTLMTFLVDDMTQPLGKVLHPERESPAAFSENPRPNPRQEQLSGIEAREQRRHGFHAKPYSVLRQTWQPTCLETSRETASENGTYDLLLNDDSILLCCNHAKEGK